MSPRRIARPVAGIFFPQREALGFDSRECTPGLLAAAIHLTAETRSFERAARTMQHLLGHGVSAKTIERLAQQVGTELAQRNETSTPEKEVPVPQVAVASCDGGRIRTRAADAGPGVHEAAWRETKNASFERMQAPACGDADPCPELPDTFRKLDHVAKIAEKGAFSGVSPEPAPPARPRYEGPQRVLRTCLSSMAGSQPFGQQMQREAHRRRFFEAERRVFIGDGLAWNWSIWKEHFSTFTPILDFIHAIQYLYAAAEAWESDGPARWARYLRFAEAAWQGRTDDVIAEIEHELAARRASDDPLVRADDVSEDHPWQPLIDAARYLRNNRQRMDYPRYRRQGLPITSSPMESLIKQINHRVKGTEMFWNDPDGAEAILQIRAASLSEDGRLNDHLAHRPGYPFTRRPNKTPTTAA